MDIISSLMVLPNRMCIPLIDQVKVDQMRFPLPRVCNITKNLISQTKVQASEIRYVWVVNCECRNCDIMQSG